MRDTVGNLLSSASLFYLPDILSFAAAYLALMGVPGYAVAVLARPRAPRTQHIAVAIPCAYALVTVSGLATAVLHLPYSLSAYLLLAAPLTAAAACVRYQRRPGRLTSTYSRPASTHAREQERDRTTDRWWLAPLAVSLTQLVMLALILSGDSVPAGFDVLSHVMWIDDIRRAHVFPLALLSSNISNAAGGFYPPAYHVLTGLVLDVVPVPAYHAAFLSVVAVIAVLPVALFAYVRMATGNAHIAGLAAIASLAFEPLPLFVEGVGLYPFVVSLLIVVAIVMALRDGLGLGDWRATALAGFLGVGLFYTHPTEFVTVAVLGLAVVPGLLRGARAWLRACGHGLIVAAVWLVAAFPELLAVRHTIVNGAQAEISVKHDFTAAPHVNLSSGLEVYVGWLYGRNVSYVLLIATIIGLVYCLTRRRYLGLAVTQLVLAAIFVDSVTYNILRPFYVLSFPWALWERLSATNYWFVLPLAAIGIEAVLPAVQWLARRRDPIVAAMVAAPVMIVGLLLPLGVAGVAGANYAYARKVVAPADLRTVSWLARHAPAGTVVINEGDYSQSTIFDVPSDAGRWMPVLGGPTPLFWRGGEGPGSVEDRLYLLRHIADTPLPPAAARFVARYHVGYVFYGAQIRPGATRYLNLARLLNSPRLRLVYSSKPTCRDGHGGSPGTATCATNGSYVFAIAASPIAASGSTMGLAVADRAGR